MRIQASKQTRLDSAFCPEENVYWGDHARSHYGMDVCTRDGNGMLLSTSSFSLFLYPRVDKIDQPQC